MQVSELFIYPIKSLGGISLPSATLMPRGFEHDRRWMLVDENGKFLTQREHAVMALLKTSISEEFLTVKHHLSGQSVDIPLVSTSNKTMMVDVWSSRCRAQWVNGHADEFFSDIMQQRCTLVYMPDTTRRMVDGRYAFDKEITSFADDFPLLLIGQSSLDDLNSLLVEPLPMNRFRPNMVFTGAPAFHEDKMKHFAIGNMEFFGVKLCARCPVTTINQDTAEKAKEPLKTLAGYRFIRNKVMFGQNLIHKGEGVVGVGDTIQELVTEPV